MSEVARHVPAVPSWFQPLEQKFADLLANNRLPHGLIISGLEGVGKEWLSLNFARRILCHQPNGHLACGDCKSCRLLVAGTHSDFRLVERLDDAKKISVDQIRDLSGFINQTSQISEWKAAVISGAEQMNLNAANALLKTLEEPPPKTLIILVTHRVQAILPTLRSRSQVWTLDAPGESVSRQWLSDSGVPEAEIDPLLELANIRPSLAWRWFSDGEFEDRKNLSSLLESALDGKVDALSAAAQLAKQDALSCLESFMNKIYQRTRSVPDRKRIGAYAGYFHSVQSLHREITRGNNPNMSLLWENVLLRWQSLQRQVDRG